MAKNKIDQINFLGFVMKLINVKVSSQINSNVPK